MWSTVSVSLLLLLLSTASGQRKAQQQTRANAQEFASDCPSPNGFFADARQCDKYYQCVDGVLTEKLCPDGLAFIDHNPRREKCDYISVVDCSGRPDLQPAQPTAVCPRQNGYFYHEDEKVCNQFYFCNAGTANLVTCPAGLVFTASSNNCEWPDTANRPGCSASGVNQFDCPAVTPDLAVAHPRYADPDDCQYFYICIDGINPRRNGCSFGHVYNNAIQACDVPTNVPECGNYYTEYFENYFDTLTTSHGQASGDIISAAKASGFEIPAFAQRISLQNNPSPANRRRRPQTSAAAAAPARAPARAPAPAFSAAPAPAPAPAPAFTEAQEPVFSFSAAPAPAPAPAPVPVPAPAPAVRPIRPVRPSTRQSNRRRPNTAAAADAQPEAQQVARRRPLVSRRLRPVA